MADVKIEFGDVLAEGPLLSKGLIRKEVSQENWQTFLDNAVSFLPVYFVIQITGKDQNGDPIDYRVSGSRIRLAKYLEDISPSTEGAVLVLNVTTDRNKARGQAPEV